MQQNDLMRSALDAIKWADLTAHGTPDDCVHWCRDVAEAAIEGDKHRVRELVDGKLRAASRPLEHSPPATTERRY